MVRDTGKRPQLYTPYVSTIWTAWRIICITAIPPPEAQTAVEQRSSSWTVAHLPPESEECPKSQPRKTLRLILRPPLSTPVFLVSS